MLLIEGKVIGEVGRVGRRLFIVTGACWSPKVFEIANCKLGDDSHESVVSLPLPCKCVMVTRHNRVSDRFDCLDHQTSDELVLDLVNTFYEMRVFVVDYTVLDEGGSLLWSENTSVADKGVLWQAGMRAPLGAANAAPKRRASAQALVGRMLSGDPFATTAGPSLETKLPGSIKGGTSMAIVGRKRRHDALADDSGAEAMVDIDGLDAWVAPGEGVAESAAALGDNQSQNEFEMDLADNEVTADGADEDELDITYSGNLAPLGEDDPEGPSNFPEEGGDASELLEMASGAKVQSAMEQAGLQDDVGGDPGHEASDAADPPPGGAPAPPEPWADFSPPSASGYVYHGGRSVMRIQRGKPAGRVTVTRYKHPACSVLINADRAPPDVDLYRWLLEVPPANSDMSPAERKALTTQHKASARAQWTAPK